MTGAPVTSGTDRRPLPARDRSVFKRSARWLARSGVTPNMISATGLLIGMLAGAALAATAWTDEVLVQRLLWLASVILIQLRGACNILDGVVAVDTGRSSPVGRLYNEVPDRVSDAATMIGAGYALGGAPVLGWAAALVAVFVAYVRTQCHSAGVRQDFCGPMAKPMRLLVIALTAVFLAVTPASCHLGWGPGKGWGLISAALLVVIVGGLVTAARRLHRAASALGGHER